MPASAVLPAPATPAGPWAPVTPPGYYDKTDIRSAEVNQPSEIAGYVRQNPSVRVEVDGSTDLLRGTQYDAGLSQRRIPPFVTRWSGPVCRPTGSRRVRSQRSGPAATTPSSGAHSAMGWSRFWSAQSDLRCAAKAEAGSSRLGCHRIGGARVFDSRSHRVPEIAVVPSMP